MVSKLQGNYLPQLEVEAVLKCNSLNIIRLCDEVTIEKEGRKNVYIVSYKGLPSKFNERLYKKEYDQRKKQLVD